MPLQIKEYSMRPVRAMTVNVSLSGPCFMLFRATVPLAP